jgi:hypothetical protein
VPAALLLLGRRSTPTLERMGPLFSFALVAALGACAFGACLVGAVFFLPVRRAVAWTVVASVGSGIGFVLAAVAAVPFVGIGQTLESGRGVVAYLVALSLGGLGGGWAAGAFYLRVTAGRGHAF